MCAASRSSISSRRRMHDGHGPLRRNPASDRKPRDAGPGRGRRPARGALRHPHHLLAEATRQGAGWPPPHGPLPRLLPRDPPDGGESRAGRFAAFLRSRFRARHLCRHHHPPRSLSRLSHPPDRPSRAQSRRAGDGAGVGNADPDPFRPRRCAARCGHGRRARLPPERRVRRTGHRQHQRRHRQR